MKFSVHCDRHTQPLLVHIRFFYSFFLGTGFFFRRAPSSSSIAVGRAPLLFDLAFPLAGPPNGCATSNALASTRRRRTVWFAQVSRQRAAAKIWTCLRTTTPWACT